MNKAILNTEVQKFITEHLFEDLSKLILKGSPFPQVSSQEIGVQISGKKKAESKLPVWFNTKKILYPPNLNLEQTSSQKTAKYKASLISGDKLIDLTGGFGIDSYFFAEKFRQLTYCELNPELFEIATHNFEILGARNIKAFQGNGIEILKKSKEHFDWIFLDPSRRDEHGGKVFHLNQCTPDISENLELLFERSENIMLKTSPLLDLKAGIIGLKQVSEIHIVAVNSDVKELLWILKKGFQGEADIKTIDFQKSEIQLFNTIFSNNQSEVPLSLPLKYIYEPNPAIMKSGMFRELAVQTNTVKLHSNSHLFTSETIKIFPGRTFEVSDIISFNRKLLKQRLKVKKANITTRNFPKSVEVLRQELKISDGGNTYLFFTTNLKNEKIVLVCKKISEEIPISNNE
ncbi:MAG: class I SAM-dependent methyltransferase [Bacteroidota bacterium]